MILSKELEKDFTVISAKLTLCLVSYTDSLRPFGDIIALIQLDDTALLLGLGVEVAADMRFEHTTL